jgi:type IV secretion system protein TrbC
LDGVAASVYFATHVRRAERKRTGGRPTTMRRIQLLQRKTFTAIANRASLVLTTALVTATGAFAQAGGNSPWENAVNVLQQAFTGTIAKGLALVAIVVGGLTFAFGEGGGKRTFAGIVFGIGMAVLAVNFLTWLFGV